MVEKNTTKKVACLVCLKDKLRDWVFGICWTSALTGPFESSDSGSWVRAPSARS